MNWIGVKAIYLHEMDRMRRTIIQSILSPVISTSLYFVVFGSAIGSRIPLIEDVSYGSFIVPGLMMLVLLTQSLSNAASGIFFPKFLGTINEIYAAPLSSWEIVMGFVGAATSKSIILGIDFRYRECFCRNFHSSSLGDDPYACSNSTDF